MTQIHKQFTNEQVKAFTQGILPEDNGQDEQWYIHWSSH